jgi:uncharacterized membrane protein YeaQ/YmgE (transglycosylase-associated protein family)
MYLTVTQLIIWIIIGLAGGMLAGYIVKGTRRGFGFPTNLGLGLLGAFIGGVLFRLFNIFPGLDKIAISLRDVVSALLGSLLVLALLWLWKRFGESG